MRVFVRRGMFMLAAISVLFVWVSASVGVQGQGQGLDQRVTVLEQLVSSLTQQVAGLSALVQRVQALEALAPRVTSLEQMTQPTVNVSVNCAGGQTIAAALGQSHPHTGILRISITGVCTENLEIVRGLTIIQGGPGAGITAANPGMPVIRIANAGFGSRVLELNGPLTISGGSTGVEADFGSHVHLRSVTVDGNSTGVSANRQALVRLQNTVVSQGVTGVVVRNGATLYVNGGGIQYHSDFGLLLESGASAEVNGALIAWNQGGAGSLIRGAVGLYAGVVLRLSNTTIRDNDGNGVFAVVGSSLWLDNNTFIDANGGHGISLSDTSVAGKFFAAMNIQITNNGRAGISCSGAPGVAQLYGFPPAGQAITVSGNSQGNINCPTSPIQ